MGSLAKKAFTDHGPMNETEWGLHGASTEMEIFRELGQEIAGLQAEARAREAEIEELVGTSSFWRKTGSETHPARPAARRRSHATGEVPF